MKRGLILILMLILLFVLFLTKSLAVTSEVVKSFDINKEEIQFSLRQGETKPEEITISNILDKKININLEIIGLENFLGLSEKSLELGAGSSKTITLKATADEDAIPDLYIGRLIIEADNFKKETPISIEIESKKSVFGIKLEVPEKYLEISPGKEFLTNINLFRREGQGKFDILLNYDIKNEKGEIVVSEQETFSIDIQTGFVKTIYLPSDLKYGRYILYIKATHNGEVSSASTWFSVVGSYPTSLEIILFGVLIFFMIVLVGVIYEIIKMKRYISRKMKIDEKILAKNGMIKIRNLKGGINKKWI